MKLWDESSQTVIFASFVFFSLILSVSFTHSRAHVIENRGDLTDPGSFSCHTDIMKLNRSLKESVQRDTHESSPLH